MSLIELMVVMVIFVALLGVIFTVLITVQRQTVDTVSRADATDQARAAFQQIDRQVRSGNVLYNPSVDAVAYPLSMRVYTQANGEQKCVQWQVVTATRELRTRSWESGGASPSATAWSVVARNLINTADTPPFTLRGIDTSYKARLIDIRLLVQTPGTPVELQSSISGRNTQYGYDPSVCNVIPAG